VKGKLIEYFRKLTLGGNAESSKRFIALFTMMLVTYIVCRFTNADNVELILAELLTFITTLLGIAAYESVRGVNTNKTDESDSSQTK
jgi:hypothetical protein